MIIIRDITTGDSHTVPPTTRCLPGPRKGETGATTGRDILPGDAEGATTLAGCEPGEQVYVESDDEGETAGSRVWWLSTVVEAAVNTALLMDYRTGETIRAATAAELDASKAAGESDGGRGAILVDGRSCYVQE